MTHYKSHIYDHYTKLGVWRVKSLKYVKPKTAIVYDCIIVENKTPGIYLKKGYFLNCK